MSKIWLITGSASGLGRHIAETALAAGERVLATARDTARLADLAARYGNRVRTAQLDVTDPAAARAAVETALQAFGGLDVVVNNAGFGHVVPFEQMTEDDFRAQIDTNLYGVVNVTRACVPVLRRQRSGHIIQVSSVGGRTGMPGLSAYQAAKWAVGGFTEVLSRELKPLGIHVTALEPGGMRTGWVARAGSDLPVIHEDYAASVGPLLEMLHGYVGNETGDPAKVAEVVLKLAYHANPPEHLLLGTDALHYAGAADAERAAFGELWRAVSASTDIATTTGIPDLPSA